MASPDDLLREQQAYYRARAPEYDQWHRRQGRYDAGPEENQRWFSEVAQVGEALRSFDPRGEVLELAAGTGWWTEQLLPYADRVTAVDGSPEALALNRARLGEQSDVEYVVADIFDWSPERAYDVVFFSFWLSHVPESAFASFWNGVRDVLRPGGRVFFVDSHSPSLPASAGRNRRSPEDASVELRRLNDGREFRVVKIFHRAEALQRTLASLGWTGAVRATERHFVYGALTPLMYR
jgi:demethylmenaquinone methyltransferase/2-methoxy-6-polyprenyl-1,4-benzoquinol methylase